jgi:hypothetical protein
VISTQSASFWRWCLNLIIAGLALSAVLLVVLWLSSRSRLSFILSSLATVPNVNGTLTHPTQGGIQGVINRLPFAAGFLALCAISVALFKRKLHAFLSALPSEWPALRELLRREFPPNSGVPLEIAIVVLITAIGVFLRLWHIGRPIHYDEAATYLNYASKPLYRALSNYSYPNNHLLNTFFAHLSIQTFGDSTFSLRLPAFLAGCSVIPLACLTGRTFYGRVAGILTAGFVAALPTFIEFSVNARGYSLQWVFILVMMCCSAILLRNPNLKTAWLLFVLAAVAGTYALPTMVIAILACAVWLLVSAVTETGLPFRQLVSYIALAGFVIALLSVLFYLPPLLASGPAALLSNHYVAPLQGSFFHSLPTLARSLWIRWTDGVPVAVVYILIAGIALGVCFDRKVSRYRVPLMLLLWAWTFCFAWARNIVGYPRVWSFLLLAAVITASAGLSLGVRMFRKPNRQVVFAGAISVGFALVIGASLLRQRLLFRNNETAALVDVSQVIDFLQATIRPGDALAVGHPGEPIIQYELLRCDPRLYAALAPLDSARQVIVVLPKPDVDSEAYTTDDLLARLSAQAAADPSAASAQIDLSQFYPPQTLAKFVSVTIYSFRRK